MKVFFHDRGIITLKHALAWMLIVMLIFNCAGPVFVYGGRGDSGSWEVMYSISKEDDTGIMIGNDSGEIVVDARAGETVFLTMQLLEQNGHDRDRFGDTFQVTLPGEIYDALVDENGTANEWFESDTTGGYLLELKDPVASGSNAGQRQNTSSNASGSNADNSDVELVFQFTEELRRESSPQDIIIENSGYILPFEVPEDMVLICATNENQCTITSEAGTAGRPSGSEWDSVWQLTVKKESGGIIKPDPGEAVEIEIGDTVNFEMSVKANTSDGTSKSFDETFNITVPLDIFEMFEGSFISHEIAGVDVFTYQAESSSDPAVVTVAFTDELKEMADKQNYEIAGGWFSFGFQSTKELIIKYTPKEDSHSCEFEHTTIREDETELVGTKTITAVFNKNGATIHEQAVKAGDYILYEINAMVKNMPQDGWWIEKGVLYDYFNTDIFSFVDISNAEKLTDIDPELGSIPESDGRSAIEEALAADHEYKSWDGPGSLPPINNGQDRPSFENGVSYQNSERIFIPYSPGSGSVSLYICLKVKPDIPPETPDSDYRNWLIWNGDTSGQDISGDKWYDAALTISSTTKMRSGTSIPEVMTSPDFYPENEKNPSFKAADGDLVTYVIRLYSQGNTDYKLKEMSISVPAGLKLLDAEDERLDGYLFAESSGKEPTMSPQNEKHINGELKDKTGFSFTAEQTGLDFESFYSVEQYSYCPDGLSVTRADNGAALYITCEVLGVDEILGNMGLDPATATEAERMYTWQYGYLMTAKVSAIVDIEEDDAAAAPAVEDEDSWHDNQPFKDWFNGDNGDVKQDRLWLYDNYEDGEKDESVSNHVRSLTGKYTVWPNGDEDDFDYATLYIGTEEKKQQDAVQKWLEIESYPADEIKGLLQSIENDSGNPGFYADYHYLNEDGALSELNTIIPYRSVINIDGSRFMNEVTFTDLLPESMEFLLRPDGKPVIMIEEIVENGSRSEVEMDTNGDGVMEKVEIIDPDFARAHRVKDFRWNDYLTAGEPATEKPSGLINGTTWDYGVNDPANDILTINFGDISNNAYRITYLGVVKEYSNVYRNKAMVKWKEGEWSTWYDFSKWGDGAAHGYGKLVQDESGGWVKNEQLESLDGGRELTYKLSIGIDSEEGFLKEKLRLFDYISDLGQGEANITGIKDIIYYNGTIENGDVPVPPEEAVFTASFLREPARLEIRNQKEITPGPQTFELVFTVVYDEIRYGSTIENTFGGTTVVDVPLKLELLKTDANDPFKGLKGAVFALTYKDGSEVLANGRSGPAVVLQTDNNGKAAAEFHLDPDQMENDKDSYELHLTETQKPDGYLGLGGKDTEPATPYVIKLKVSRNQDGEYEFEAIDENQDYSVLTTGSSGQIQITARNYPLTGTLEIGFDLKKKLLDAETGASLPLNAYKFEMKLKEGDNTGVSPTTAVVSNSTADGIIRFEGISITKAGTYKFEISEKIPANPDPGHDEASYDPGTITVTVVAEWGEDGKLMQKGDTGYEKTLPSDRQQFFDPEEGGRHTAFINFFTDDDDDGGGNGGGGDGGGGGTPGSAQETIVSIADNSSPVAQLTDFIEDTAIPLSGLVSTGDDSRLELLLIFMLTAAVGLGALLIIKKRNRP